MSNVQVVEANVEEIIAMVSNLHIGMVTELNMAAALKSFDWWYDSGATVHVCNDRSQFKISPYDIWNGQKPNLNYLRVWGCLAFYRVFDPNRIKLGPRATKCVFVGYDENSKAYKLLDLD
ncbi:UNVERIFIED_CONTAM: hypothetical protein Sradi_1772300 [Sesamum radiatum]|uniref:Retroviral polymerase SH3-like domain-containing protein n=1 Tax=Sesamum radiatum TaxID=300843 RepID=A0AAW2TV89_SESRA